jgi:hypothetical protein
MLIAFLDHAGLVHMARNLEELGARDYFRAQSRRTIRASAAGSWDDRDALYIVDRGRAAIEARAGREWRLETRLALLALEAFEHRGLFAADVSARAAMHEDVEVIAGLAGVLADQAGLIGLLNSGLEDLGFIDIFAADM